MWKIVWSIFVVLALAVGGAWSLALSAEPVDREAWVVYECNDLAMVVFVKSDNSIEGFVPETGDDVKNSLERAHLIPQERRYYIAVARYCPYTKRRV